VRINSAKDLEVYKKARGRGSHLYRMSYSFGVIGNLWNSYSFLQKATKGNGGGKTHKKTAFLLFPSSFVFLRFLLLKYQLG
jgi:hypothetical protein